MASLLEAQFIVSKAQHCPFYNEGDEFVLSGFGFSVKNNKPVCLLLTREITNIILESSEGSLNSADVLKGMKEFTCGGCTGMIKFILLEDKEFQTPQMRMMAALEDKSQKDRQLGSFDNLANTFSFLRVLDDVSLKEIIDFLKTEKYDKDEVIIRLGQPGRNLYMIVTGKVTVIDAHDHNIAYLGRGEIFGEMSLFTGKPTCATIQAVDEVKLFSISGKDLSQLFIKRPFLQMAFSRILAQRISEANTSVAVNLAYDMSGQLGKMALTEVLQMFNENQKTGVVFFELINGKQARIAFSDGEIVKAEYAEVSGEEALYALLKEKEGRFFFDTNLPLEEMGAPPLGNFMKLLMDGMRHIDEEEAEGEIGGD